MNRFVILCLSLAVIGSTGCHQGTDPASAAGSTESIHSKGRTNEPLPNAMLLDACRIILAPLGGLEPVDQEIARLQRDIRSAQRVEDANRLTERLGWLYVKKARRSFDPGFYKLAEQCGLCLESKRPEAPETLLLRAYALQSLHRFKEAEPIARRLVNQREAPFDYGLLGDILLDLGEVDQAVGAYRTMMDLKPDLHAFVRASQARWLKGDVEGAIEALEVAASATSQSDLESAAWVWTRLAQYQFQMGGQAEAERACASALEFHKDYPPALLLRGRMWLAEGSITRALESLRRAAELNPLPEYWWVLTEALRAAGIVTEAEKMEARLRTHGVADDPRSLSLFLATRGEDPSQALRLAERELAERSDVFTHDAMAWALAASGRMEAAQEHLAKALAQGTEDGRLFLHAAVIAAKANERSEAQNWLCKASALRHLLLPSERAQFDQTAFFLGEGSVVRSASALSPPSFSTAEE
jgi:tetratricopeptide (TPR) repeat protein